MMRTLPNTTKIVVFVSVIFTTAFLLWGFIGVKSFAPWPTEGPK